ncbi:hypothetical protein [Rhodococcus sp. LB1]|uniref:hypothetical protein n=1 Tax=Rhodococcus sp. LB1 TaxID=1807499 RepID=UPI00077A6736|nr:hypothetical protein [Rhodococcus sp. LB1]KXX58064.1 hypothetical protein AZG88_09025 [Rhodococcus sp. LB1]
MPDRNDTRTPHRDYRALIDGREVQVVGHLHTSPHHPDPGATITPFEDLAEPGTGAHLFALVSVRCATDDTTVDPNTGLRHNKYFEGLFGKPNGTSWYLTPAVYDPRSRTYALGSQALAAGLSIGALHDDVLEVVSGAGYAAPAGVRVHDFPVRAPAPRQPRVTALTTRSLTRGKQ